MNVHLLYEYGELVGVFSKLEDAKAWFNKSMEAYPSLTLDDVEDEYEIKTVELDAAVNW